MLYGGAYMGKIYIIMGKSATGKDTIYKRLITNESLMLQSIVTYTTRPIRSGEKNGVEYHFCDEDTLNNAGSNGSLIEHRQYDTIHGLWHYFSVDDGSLNLEQYDYLIIGTLEMYNSYLKYFGTNKIVPIYIYVDDYTRLRRALDREALTNNPKYAELCRRFLADCEDFSEEKLKESGIDSGIVNDEIDNCVETVIKYINQHRERG